MRKGLTHPTPQIPGQPMLLPQHGKQPKMSFNRWRDDLKKKKKRRHIYSRMLISCKEKWSHEIYRPDFQVRDFQPTIKFWVNLNLLSLEIILNSDSRKGSTNQQLLPTNTTKALARAITSGWHGQPHLLKNSKTQTRCTPVISAAWKLQQKDQVWGRHTVRPTMSQQ